MSVYFFCLLKVYISKIVLKIIIINIIKNINISIDKIYWTCYYNDNKRSAFYLWKITKKNDWREIKMISLATKHNDPSKKLGIVERVGYGLGDFSCNLVYQPITAFLLLYYTNVVGVSAGTAASVLAVSKIFDAFSDVVMGSIVDRTKSKYGKARPWILRMCLPMAICIILMFSVPQALGGMARIAWMFVTYNLVSTVCYTAINLPYSAMLCQMTTNSEERGIISTIRIVFAVSGQFFINTAVLKLVGVLGNGDTYDQKGWTMAFAIVAVLSMIVFLICFLTTKERVVETEKEKEEKISPIVSLKSLFHNKYWLMVTAASIFTYLWVGVYFGSVAYYAQYNMGSIDKYPLIANSMTVAELIGLIVLVPIMMKKLGKYKTYQIGIAMMALGCAGTLLVPTSVTGVCIMNIIKGIGQGAETAMIYGMIADTIDYGEWKDNIKCVGMGNAACSFSMKVGNALGTAILGWILTFGGFDANQAVQSASALRAISVSFIIVPAILLALNFAVMIFYRLDKEYPKIAEDLAKRRNM